MIKCHQLSPSGFLNLLKNIRELELALGGYGPRQINKSELEKIKSLRK